MLKSNGAEGRGVSAKVADFGLSVKMDHMETHMSNTFQGTMVSAGGGVACAFACACADLLLQGGGGGGREAVLSALWPAITPLTLLG